MTGGRAAIPLVRADVLAMRSGVPFEAVRAGAGPFTGVHRHLAGTR